MDQRNLSEQVTEMILEMPREETRLSEIGEAVKQFFAAHGVGLKVRPSTNFEIHCLQLLPRLARLGLSKGEQMETSSILKADSTELGLVALVNALASKRAGQRDTIEQHFEYVSQILHVMSADGPYNEEIRRHFREPDPTVSKWIPVLSSNELLSFSEIRPELDVDARRFKISCEKIEEVYMPTPCPKCGQKKVVRRNVVTSISSDESTRDAYNCKNAQCAYHWMN
jgi:hypothetical protein